MRLGDDVLAQVARVAGGRCLAELARTAAGEVERGQPDRLVSRSCRFLACACSFGGSKTGPSPVNRRKSGSKHQLITDAGGIPLAFLLTAANRNDCSELVALVDATPPIRGKRGRPKRRPACVVGDRGYQWRAASDQLRRMRIRPLIAERRTEHGSGLGKQRWVVERTLSSLHQHRRLRIRYERRADIHEAFVSIACSLVCLRALRGTSETALVPCGP